MIIKKVKKGTSNTNKKNKKIMQKNKNILVQVLRLEEAEKLGGKAGSYSTVTHLAKFLGLSGSNSLRTDT